MAFVTLATRAVAWRRGASIAVLLVFLVTITAATTGPFYVHAASESVLRDTLATAPAEATAQDVTDLTSPTTTAGLAALQRTENQAGPQPYYGPPLRSLRLALTFAPNAELRNVADLVWREGGCAQLVVAAGRCPTGSGEVMIHADLARKSGLRIGDPVNLDVHSDSAQEPSVPVRLHVVGFWTPRSPSSTFWTGHSADLRAYPSDSDYRLDHSQALFTSAATFDTLARMPSPRPFGSAETLRLLDVGSVRLADVPTLRRTTGALTATVTGSGGTVLTELPSVLDGVAHDNHRLRTATVLILGQLLALCLAVLLLVVSTSAQARASEIAAAKVRGLRPLATVVLALGEPLLLLALATPAGLAAGYGLAELLTWIRLAPDTPVAFVPSVLEALAVALVGAGLATAWASRHALATPAIELWQRTPRRTARFARASVARDVGLAAVAVGALVAVRLAGDPWVLLSPIPIALLAALLGLRLLPVVCAPLMRASRGDRHVARFLAVRQIVRRTEGAQVTALLVVAFALAATATTAWSVDRVNARDRAATQTGAATVFFVQPAAGRPDTVDLLGKVRRADPSGREAMAVEEYLPFSGQPGGRVLAVDAARFAAVANWRSDFAGPSPATLVARLHQVGTRTLPAAVITRPALRDAAVVPGAPAGVVGVTGVDGNPLDVRTVATAHVLPRVGLDGTLIDLDQLTSLPYLSTFVSRSEVWLAPGVSASTVSARLAAVGLTVTGSESAAGAQKLLNRQGPPLAVLLSLTAAILAVILAGATTICAVHLSGRRRAFELAALAAVGVAPRQLRRATGLEALALLLAALVLGVAAGAVGSAVTLPRTPVFADDLAVPPLILTPSPLVVVLAAAAAVAVSLIAAAVSSRLLIRAAVPARLRESQT